MARRIDDSESRSVFRSDRFFFSDGKWFFNTREAETLGPYARRAEAEVALTEFIIAKTGMPPGAIDPWSKPGATN